MRDIVQIRIERCEENIHEIKGDIKELKQLVFNLDKNVFELKTMQEARKSARKSVLRSWRGLIGVLAAIGGFMGGLYEHFRG